MRKNTTDFIQRFQRWKAGEQVYDKGRPIPHYAEGEDAYYGNNRIEPITREAGNLGGIIVYGKKPKYNYLKEWPGRTHSLTFSDLGKGIEAATAGFFPNPVLLADDVINERYGDAFHHALRDLAFAGGPVGKGAMMGLGASGLLSENGVQKTVEKFGEGDIWGGTKSLVGDVLNAAMTAYGGKGLNDYANKIADRVINARLQRAIHPPVTEVRSTDVPLLESNVVESFPEGLLNDRPLIAGADDEFVKFLSSRVGGPVIRRPIKNTKLGDIYSDGFSFVDETGKEIAHIAGQKRGDGLFVESSFVDPQYRSSGIGRQMYYDFNKESFQKYGSTLHSSPYQHQLTLETEPGSGVFISPSSNFWRGLKQKGLASVEGSGLNKYYVMAQPKIIQEQYELFPKGLLNNEPLIAGAVDDVNKFTDINFKWKFLDNVDKQLSQAYRYKHSSQYKNLVEMLYNQAKDAGIEINKEYFQPVSIVKRPTVVLKKRTNNNVGGYRKFDNVLELDPSQMTNVEMDNIPFHEGLHWQLVGEENSPLYRNWSDALRAKDNGVISESEYLNEFDKYYNSKEFQLNKNTKTFLQDIVNSMLRSSAPDYIRKPNEIIAHGLESGRAIGLTPFQEYPAKSRAALNAMLKAVDYDEYLSYLNVSDNKKIQNFWNILTGQFLP